jgi:hypothetical protein
MRFTVRPTRANSADQILDEAVERVGRLRPRAGRARHARALAEPALAADHARGADELLGRRLAQLRQLVECRRELADDAAAARPDAHAALAVLRCAQRLEQPLQVGQLDHFAVVDRARAVAAVRARGRPSLPRGLLLRRH